MELTKNTHGTNIVGHGPRDDSEEGNLIQLFGTVRRIITGLLYIVLVFCFRLSACVFLLRFDNVHISDHEANSGDGSGREYGEEEMVGKQDGRQCPKGSTNNQGRP